MQKAHLGSFQYLLDLVCIRKPVSRRPIPSIVITQASKGRYLLCVFSRHFDGFQVDHYRHFSDEITRDHASMGLD